MKVLTLCFVIISMVLLPRTTLAKREGLTIGIHAVAGTYSSDGNVQYTFSNLLGVPQLGLSETYNAKIEEASASGGQFHIGYFIAPWFSWSILILGSSADDNVNFTASNGTQFDQKVSVDMAFITPFAFTFYPSDIFYFRLAPGLIVEAGETTSNINNLEKAEFGTKGGGFLLGLGFDFLLSSWVSFNVGVNLLYGNTEDETETKQVGASTTFTTTVAGRDINYGALDIGLNFYF